MKGSLILVLTWQIPAPDTPEKEKAEEGRGKESEETRKRRGSLCSPVGGALFPIPPAPVWEDGLSLSSTLCETHLLSLWA